MACGGCGRKRKVKYGPLDSPETLKGGYKYLTDKQLKARLEVYKRNNCKDCGKRYECDWGMFTKCKKNK
jgi:hypothetical protein